MHLSLLSDSSLSDTALISQGHGHRRGVAALGRDHRDGVLRGLAFLAAIALPLGLAIATGHAGPGQPSAGYAQSFDAER